MAKKVTETPPIFDVKDYGKLEFKDWASVREFVREELAFWKGWTQPAPTILGYADDRRNQFWGYISQALDALNRVVEGNEINAVSEVCERLNQYFASGLMSRTARAAYVKKLRGEPGGEIVAPSALAAYLGSAIDSQSDRQPADARYPSFRGRLAMALFDMGLGEKVSDAMNQSSNAMVSEFVKRMTEQGEESSKLLETMRTTFDRFAKEHTASQEQREATVANVIAVMEDEKAAAIKSIDDKKAAFTEYMKLKAPVEYWSKKATAHKGAAMWRGFFLGAFAVVGSAALGEIFHRIYQQAALLASSEKGSAGLIVLTGAAAAATTIIFWVGRFLQRMYLSERHLGIDAAHRSTLVECYLALTEEGKVSDADRALVLPALFRAGTDGIVQDDASIDGLLAMLARHMEKPGK